MLLRRGVSAALVFAALAFPVAARADAGAPCRIPPGTPAVADAPRVQSLVFNGPGATAERLLGRQFAGTWLHPSDGTWYVGVAPGGLGVEGAQQAIGAQLGVGPDADFLRERLRVVAEPYAWADLKAVRDNLFKAFSKQQWDVGFTSGVGCSMSDSWRVEVMLFKDSGKFVTLATKVMAQRYGGDRVIVRRLNSAAPRVISVSPGPVRTKKKR
jgi:hypothetical protein